MTRVVPISIITYLIAYFINNIMNENFLSFILNVILSIISTCSIIYILGLNLSERKLVKELVFNKFLNKLGVN